MSDWRVTDQYAAASGRLPAQKSGGLYKTNGLQRSTIL
jgi:hypothetical protein